MVFTFLLSKYDRNASLSSFIVKFTNFLSGQPSTKGKIIGYSKNFLSNILGQTPVQNYAFFLSYLKFQTNLFFTIASLIIVISRYAKSLSGILLYCDGRDPKKALSLTWFITLVLFFFLKKKKLHIYIYTYTTRYYTLSVKNIYICCIFTYKIHVLE